ncbi:MAG: PQQ-binding-like beta-propeller repeat protein [Planctomycetes bacterium]|nr:PQQ-binding-like beta-propeller repeat protein [Planctomycetota bacterium]
MTLLALASALIAATAAAQVRGNAADEPPVETHSFSLPDTRLVRALFESAEAHAAARRWREAIAEYQRILEDHRGDLLGAERPRNASGHVSDQPVHPGAAQRVRDRLFELPPEARALYAERHGRDARLALEVARASGDERALVEVARRWPLTPAAVSAWWTLGDLDLESGRAREAVYAWARALAFELGAPRAVPGDALAWREAAARLAARGPLADGVARRIELAAEVARAGGRDELALVRHLRLPGGDERGGPPPGPEDDTWPEPYRLPWHPLQSSSRGDGVFAAKSGDRLFVTTGLRLLALAAFGGGLVWDSGEPAGWETLDGKSREDLFLGVDESGLVLAPAATADVAVAALQVPYARLPFEQFQRIGITVPIPERRLHAFDARTGALLWSHAPPRGWDGESGGLAQRSTCAGPPVIAGRRVVVPLVRMQGRIDLHVAAFDLSDGSLIWSTALISGQRELNMFGRPEKEFAGPPVRVEGDRVIVQTQLGVVAAVDLFSGEILWQTLYDQIPLPPTQDFRAPRRATPWRTTPPVVADGVVIATPYDSYSVIGIDIETGALAWQWRADRLHMIAGAPPGSIDQLLGAAGRTVFLGGERVVALELSGGLRSAERPRARWTWPRDDESRYRIGRPALIGDRVIVPLDSERVEIAADDGRVLSRIPWPGRDGGGNLLGVPGELYTTSPHRVRGVFEWTALVARARAESAARPRDVDAALALARLLSGRAAADWARGLGEPARARFAEARGVLEAALAVAGRGTEPALSLEFAATLRGEARVRAELADTSGALELLTTARAHALTPSAARGVLLDRIAILRARGPSERTALLLALDDLNASSGAEPLAVEIDGVREGAELALRVSLLAHARPEEAGEAAFQVPCALWVRLERALIHAASGDTEAEYAELHAILDENAEVSLGGTSAGELATERILALLAQGRTVGYAPFEQRAQASLDAARAAKDAQALERVALSFPGSRAARDANDALLALALERADLESVARIVAAELPSEVPASTLDERTARLGLHLAETARRAGNRALAAELVRSLADARPDLVPGAPAFDGRSLAELATAEPRFEDWAGTSEVGRFQGDFRERQAWTNQEHEVLGLALSEHALGEGPAGAPRELLVLQMFGGREGRGGALRLLSSDDPAAPRWTVELAGSEMPRAAGATPWSRRAAFAPGRLILALREDVRAFDTASGAVVWSAQPEGGAESVTVAAASGVVVVSTSARGERGRLEARDARGGALLWRAVLPEGGLHRTPLVSERRVVLLPPAGQTRTTVRDLFTGRLVARFDLPTAVVGGVEGEAWTERGLVIVPWFDEMRLAERNHVVAFDLDRGSLAWRLPFDLADRRMLTGVIQQGSRTWLRIGSLPRDEDPLPPPLLAELSVDLGAASPLDAARLGPEDVVIGLPRDTRVRLPDGPLLVLSPSSVRDGTPRKARLRAIDPRRGELWVQTLAQSFDDLRASGQPQAAWSESTVVVALPLYDGRQRPPELRTILSFYDRATGAARETRRVERVDKQDQVQLHAFGEALILKRPRTLEILR